METEGTQRKTSEAIEKDDSNNETSEITETRVKLMGAPPSPKQAIASTPKEAQNRIALQEHYQ